MSPYLNTVFYTLQPNICTASLPVTATPATPILSFQRCLALLYGQIGHLYGSKGGVRQFRPGRPMAPVWVGRPERERWPAMSAHRRAGLLRQGCAFYLPSLTLIKDGLLRTLPCANAAALPRLRSRGKRPISSPTNSLGP